MNYKKLFQSNSVTHVGLIGTGAFGRSFLAQSRLIPGIRVCVVCDQDIKIAEDACLQAGMASEHLKTCHTESESNHTIASGKTAVISDALLMMDLPIDVVIEATGMPEFGAIHARSAIEHGKHVIMITKEADCVVGPILSRLAEDAGVVYTPADGDQPSLLIGLISWAETLGFEIASAGKASELDFVYDPAAKTIARGSQTVAVAGEDTWEPAGDTSADKLRIRHQALAALPRFSVADLCETAIVINATGCDFDAPRLHAPIARIIEMPEVMCSRTEGGILQKEGVIDIVNCLRRPDEISLAGGVFVIVKCRGKKTWQFLKDKGHLVNRAGTRAMIFRPYHLLGVETATSVLAAKHLKLSTGGADIKPRVDIGIRASGKLRQGRILTMQSDHSIAGVLPEIIPAGTIHADSPVPYYLAAGCTLRRDVAAGQLLTCGMIHPEPKSCLWDLRREQDRLFEQNL